MNEGFSSQEARRIVGISQRCLDYWDEQGIVRPSRNPASGTGTVREYTFDDLLKLAVVKRLRKGGLSLQRIRKGLNKLRNAGEQVPLRDNVLVTDGKRFLRRKGNDTLEDVLANGQLVFGVVALGDLQEELTKKSEKTIKLRKAGTLERRRERHKRARDARKRTAG